jgi:anti-sigma regulatory factor (Ser/Thr protein kinase)
MKHSNSFNITTPANPDHLNRVLKEINAFAQQAGAAEDQVGQIELVLEELLVNIMNYAYPQDPGTIEIRYQLSQPSLLKLEILDHGVPFDPLSIPEVDTEATLEERSIGGLGIYLVRNIAEHIEYQRQDGKNMLTVSMALTP